MVSSVDGVAFFKIDCLSVDVSTGVVELPAALFSRLILAISSSSDC